MPSTKGRITIPATIDGIGQVAEALDDLLAESGIDDGVLSQIHLATEEAVTNVVTHAYDKKGGNITVLIEMHHGEVIVSIADQGPAFDPTQIPPPDITADLDHRVIGGLGVHLIRSVMDEVVYSRSEDGNLLTMKKKVG
ncbi:MAG TPA: ATP-binding protein [Methanospirillum sp.]|nr:ATP-binding protein [Methanospirillum sp.]